MLVELRCPCVDAAKPTERNPFIPAGIADGIIALNIELRAGRRARARTDARSEGPAGSGGGDDWLVVFAVRSNTSRTVEQSRAVPGRALLMQ